MPSTPTSGSSARPDPAYAGTLADELRPSFKGPVITPQDSSYEEVRAVWNGMAERRPALIARCTDAEDVAAAVAFGRARDLATSVRGGGHNVAGRALSPGGLTIDLSLMRDVTVDPTRRLVRAQGGCRLADVDAATARHALVVPAGIVSDTGIAGLTLGGGGGWLSRKYAMSCDNLQSVELVTADGQILGASDDSHPDLMWGLRGGGGNFGVVTEFRFRAHHLPPELLVGISVYRAEDTAEALLDWAERYPDLPDEISTHAILKQALPALPVVPPELHGRRGLLLVAMYVGDRSDKAAEPLIDTALSAGKPSARTATAMPFAFGIQRFIDADFAPGSRYYTKEAHINELPEAAIGRLVEGWHELDMDGEIEIMGMGGAVARIPEDATAFANRHHLWWFNFAMKWQDPAQDTSNIGRIRAVHDSLRPWLGNGIYANMLNFDETDRIVDAYGGPENYQRLGKVKATYDPSNFFQINANITPAPAA
jgi:FAD/FMN-containing dehydrogenase